MTTLKDKEMYTNGGIFHLQGNYFESKDVKEAVLEYKKHLEFENFHVIRVANEEETKIIEKKFRK